MAKVKVAVVGTVGRVVQIDPRADYGALLGTNVYTPDGAVGTPATVRAWLGVAASGSAPAGGVTSHRLLQGLTIGDDHPQYLRKDTLTTEGDIYVRGASTVERLGVGAEDEVLKVVGGVPAWATDERGVVEIIAGYGIDVDDYDPAAPVVSIIPTLTFLTENDETAELPGSRMLVAGTNVTFDTTTPGILEISATGGSGGGVDSVIGTPTEIDVDDYDPANPVLSLATEVLASLDLADTAVQPARQIISGGGLTGGGDLSADRTLVVGAGTGITVNADDVQVSAAYQALINGAIQSSVLTTNGDILTRTAGVPARIGIGTDTYVLTVVSGAASWQPAGHPVGANPTGTVGLAAVNGVATTFMRSDGAPALDQGIVPTWTGAHVFTVNASISNTAPSLRLIETDAAADGQRWQIRAQASEFTIIAALDDGSAIRNAFSATRTSNTSAITALALGNATNVPTLNLMITDLQINSSSGTAGYYLRSGGAGAAPTWAVLPTTATGANPTASVGLTAVNGSASTFMRSDGAPPIDQGIVPTWSGAHTFTAITTYTNRIDQSGTSCVQRWTETDAGTDEQVWRMTINAAALTYSTRTDADAAGRTVWSASRTGVAVTSIQFGNNTDSTSCQFPTGGGASAPPISFLTDTDTGLFRAAANTPAISAGAAEVIRFNSNGAIGVNSANYGTAGQVMMSFGSGATADWQDTSVVFRYPGLGYYYVYDFVYDPTTSAGDGWDVVNAGTGASVSSTAGVSGHPGIIKLNSGTTSTAAYAGVIHSSQGGAAPVGGFSIGSGTLTCVIVFRFVTLLPVSATSDAQASIGILDEVTDEPTNGCFFQTFFDSGTFKVRGCARAASADTVTSSSYLTPTLDQWYVGKIVVNAAGTSVQFFIDGASIGTVASGLPATTAPLAEGFVYAKNTSSATNPGLEIDVVETWYKLTTARY